jgi:hypothetical protein
VFGLLAIIIGLVLHRSWAKNFWFRTIHLAMIGIVVLESWLNIPCPLTVWENRLRRSAGQDGYGKSFVEYWVHKIMYYEFPPWVFTVLYTAFGLAVLLTFVLGPPRSPWRKATAKCATAE